MKRLLAPLALGAALALGGCGLHPLYAGGEHGVVANTLSMIEVGPIAGQSGWLMRNALNDRLGASGHATPRYRLEVELDDQITGFGVRTDNSVTRERRALRARYRLVEVDKNTVLLDATAGSDAGIDVVTSEYAVIAAEQSALERLTGEIAEQIIARVALYASRTGGAAPLPPAQ
jgi:LPS-assembly lipoprotein